MNDIKQQPEELTNEQLQEVSGGIGNQTKSTVDILKTLKEKA